MSHYEVCRLICGKPSLENITGDEESLKRAVYAVNATIFYVIIYFYRHMVIVYHPLTSVKCLCVIPGRGLWFLLLSLDSILISTLNHKSSLVYRINVNSTFTQTPLNISNWY